MQKVDCHKISLSSSRGLKEIQSILFIMDNFHEYLDYSIMFNSSASLLTKLDIQDLDVVLRTSRMRWFGHVERSTGWIAEVCKLNVVAQKISGRPKKSWDKVIMTERS